MNRDFRNILESAPSNLIRACLKADYSRGLEDFRFDNLKISDVFESDYRVGQEIYDDNVIDEALISKFGSPLIVYDNNYDGHVEVTKINDYECEVDLVVRLGKWNGDFIGILYNNKCYEIEDFGYEMLSDIINLTDEEVFDLSIEQGWIRSDQLDMYRKDPQLLYGKISSMLYDNLNVKKLFLPNLKNVADYENSIIIESRFNVKFE